MTANRKPTGEETTKAERVAIVGSRAYPRLELVEAFVGSLPAGTVVVSGGARGVDSIAEATARDRNLDVVVYQADWDHLGRKAGPLRNAEIVANADRIVAFWDGHSRGTLNTLAQADRAGLPVELFDSDGGRVPIGLWRDAAARMGVVATIAASGRRGKTMRRAVATIVGWMARALRRAKKLARIDQVKHPVQSLAGDQGPSPSPPQVPCLTPYLRRSASSNSSPAASPPRSAKSEPIRSPTAAPTTAANDGKPKPVASRHHPSGRLPEHTRLAYVERCVLAERLRTQADTEPGLTRAERAELRRRAQNLECAGRIIERKYAQFNRHPEHPTIQ